MIVTLTKDYDGRKAGESFDITQDEAAILVKTGYAVESKAEPDIDQAAKALESKIGELVQTAVQSSINKAFSGVKLATGNFAVQPLAAEADKTKSFADNLRCIVAVQKRQDPEAFERLAKVYAGNRRFKDGVDGIEVVKALSGASGGEGGFMIAPEYVNDLFKLNPELAVFAPFARPVNMTSREQIRPALAQTGAPASADSSPMFAGIRIHYKGEKAARTESQPAFEQIDMVAYDATGYTEASRDLLADSPGTQSELQMLFRDAMGYNIDWVSLHGNGVAKALGALHEDNPALLSITRGTASKFTYADALKMVSRLYMPAANNAFWLMSQTVMEEIGNFSLNNNPVFIANNGGAQQSLPQMLLGYPIKYTEKLPALGDTGDVCLVNPSYYYFGYLQQLEVGVSDDFKFDQDVTAFRFKMRWAGMPALKGKIKLQQKKTSGNTEVSPFIVLGPAAG